MQEQLIVTTTWQKPILALLISVAMGLTKAAALFVAMATVTAWLMARTATPAVLIAGLARRELAVVMASATLGRESQQQFALWIATLFSIYFFLALFRGRIDLLEVFLFYEEVSFELFQGFLNIKQCPVVSVLVLPDGFINQVLPVKALVL